MATGEEMVLDCVCGEDMWDHRNGSSSGGAVTAALPKVIWPWQLVVFGNGDPLDGRPASGKVTPGDPDEAGW